MLRRALDFKNMCFAPCFFVDLKVSLITLTNRAYSVNKNICFNSIIQSCYVQYQSNNVSDS